MTTITIISVLVLAAIGSALLVYFKEDADLTITLNRGFLVGIVKMTTVIEDEQEIDHSYQVCLGVLIMTLTWTRNVE
tara:strand:+ start:636 stop:866 length:231 start_codon:yes stop_codon:yes gene_type:complete